MRKMMYANYHTHTARCQHASGQDREYIEAAIEAGIQILGFSDHCPWIFPDGYISSIRMAPTEVENYVFSLETLRKEYEKDIKLLIGLEAEYLPSLMEAQERLLEDLPLDYMILGQHFLDAENKSTFTGTPGNDESTLKTYVDMVIEAIETGKYLYVAHPDLIHYTGSDAIYEKHMLRLCQYLKSKNVPLEINMLGAFQGRHYPSDKFLRIVQKAGNTCIIGIDAHAPEQLLNKEGEIICKKITDQYQLTLCEPPLA